MFRKIYAECCALVRRIPVELASISYPAEKDVGAFVINRLQWVRRAKSWSRSGTSRQRCSSHMLFKALQAFPRSDELFGYVVEGGKASRFFFSGKTEKIMKLHDFRNLSLVISTPNEFPAEVHGNLFHRAPYFFFHICPKGRKDRMDFFHGVVIPIILFTRS